MKARASNFPPEFALVAACCRWPPSDTRNAAIRGAVTSSLDWDAFLRVVTRQRVPGLVRDGLARAQASCPAQVMGELNRIVAAMVRQNLKHAAESVRLQKMFDEAGVPLLFVKGVTLAQLAYGTLALKHSWDIDLLVAPETVPRALELLARAGYKPFPALPPVTDKRYARWLKFAHEYILFHRFNSVHIEIHWRLADNNYFLPGVDARSPTVQVRLCDGADLRTLIDDDLFAYLCVHGACHAWSRLKWLADLAALLAQDSARDARQRLEQAKKSNAEHSVAQAYLLCDRLFETPCVRELAQSLREKHRYRLLEQIALRAMTSGGAQTELGDAPFDRLPALLSHFLLGRGWRYGARELWNKLNGPFDLRSFALPNWLGAFYPLLRVVAFVKRGGRMRPWPVPPNGAVD
jgi:hypothetical protein